MEGQNDDFWAIRRCLREPIPQIFEAAHLLDRAVGAHLAGDPSSAATLIHQANMPIIRAWTESLWGSKSANPDQWKYQRRRELANPCPFLDKAERIPVRMPNRTETVAIIDHYGRNCAFCGIPVIRAEVRTALKAAYPDVAVWGGSNSEQHAALQCMWMQFDHLLPHSRGGDNSVQNVAITCAPCNYGRGDWTLEEVGLRHPSDRLIFKTSWDGLERFFQS